ncbi:dihydroxy-acid dehydratase [Rubrobacter taiwanensis]|uniref:Dihydroxy-acid dehydratase n=1 Tax=Rubrobacter taiwanensis TaxID=185139 RepID=A0A4R1BQG9_9ACTN|nr:L-arabinonate dehydratase [Rubrobacter taiwanensis]TCJ19979.1 dihydroxy-acid dehydratase [Rubrobacter taiwanensis]
MRRKKSPEELRSYKWYGVRDLRSFGHRSRTKQMGYSSEDYMGKPVIGIINTWSDINPCHTHFRERAEEIKRGVWQAGGFPVELPAISLSEPFQKPSTMLYRNLLAMETEELLRSHPIDGAVLMGGCDKTTPALLMGAISMDLPAIFVPAGPMLRGYWRGQILGSGSDVWKFWADKRAGLIGEREWQEIENGIARSPGHCMTMGTASTMTSAAEAMGMTLPGAASIPAADSNHPRMASASGRRIVEMVLEDLRPSEILTEQAYENAVTTVLSLGGSTNAVIHLIALARRSGVDLDLRKFDEFSRRVPVLADIRPGGRHLMEDFYYAGGLPALLERLRDLLHTGCLTVNGHPLGENIAGAEVYDDAVIRRREDPVSEEAGLAVLWGNLAPDGCVIKHGAADPNLLQHRGRAVVFESYNDMERRINDESLPVDESSVLVLRNSGPLGAPGMPEWGMLPIPDRLLKRGVRDMVRISDARMSGTSYGTCVLHVAPESFVGGPLALVKTGDYIELDVPNRSIRLDVGDEELERRRAEWEPPEPRYHRGYGAVFSRHVTQADRGCDFDFLERGAAIPDPEIH